MRILIATASRHGSTRELGQWLGTSLTERLATAGTEATVEVRDAADVDSIAEYDAVVIGSAVYMGRWLRSARSLVTREQAELETRPTWLFSSGPVGDSGSAAALSKSHKATWAVEHRIFAGKLNFSALSWFERLVVRMIHARGSDDRSRADVDAWADKICAALSGSRSINSTA